MMLCQIEIYSLSDPVIKLLNLTTGVQIGSDFTAAPVGSSLIQRVFDLGSVPDGEYALESPFPPARWFLKIAGGLATVYDSKTDSGTFQLTVLPSVAQSADRTTGPKWSAFEGERLTIPIVVVDAGGNPISLTSKTLSLVFSTIAGDTVATITPSAVVSNVATIQLPQAVVSQSRLLEWFLKEDPNGTKIVLASGTLEVCRAGQ